MTRVPVTSLCCTRLCRTSMVLWCILCARVPELKFHLSGLIFVRPFLALKMTDWGLDLSAVIRKERFSKSNVHWVEILTVLTFEPFCFLFLRFHENSFWLLFHTRIGECEFFITNELLTTRFPEFLISEFYATRLFWKTITSKLVLIGSKIREKPEFEIGSLWNRMVTRLVSNSFLVN